MKKKKLFIAFVSIIILLLIPVSFTITDKIRYDNGKEAIFVWDIGGGGEVIIYKGIFYSILYFYPETTIDDNQEISSEWVWFWED